MIAVRNDFYKFLFFVTLTLMFFRVLDVDCVAIGDPYHKELFDAIGQKERILFYENRLTPEKERSTEFWLEEAQRYVKERVTGSFNSQKAKNIILLLGDGMSIATITAARILKGQRQGCSGEESILTFDKFPFTGLVKTYCTNGQTPDSACTATAYLCGVKTNVMMLGVNANVQNNNCSDSMNKEHQIDSIVQWAQKAGKSTGLVTTTTITHASPSAGYAHVANRLWECDNDINTMGAIIGPGEECKDIAQQLITSEPGKNLNVILGGGMGKFLPKHKVDAFGVKGERRDGLDLIDHWQSNNPQGIFVRNLEELEKVDFNQTKQLLGLFHSSHLEYYSKAKVERPKQPRLKDMTKAAIKTLEKNSEGYFLFIEGGRIDHGHHETKAAYALDETLEFDEAIQTALDLTDHRETLIVVTSDHSHTMTISGYPSRGNPILGLNERDLDSDGVPYSVLNYAIGPQQYMDSNGKRLDLTNFISDNMIFPSYIKALMGTHAGEDVAIFARGPQADLFSGTLQQNVIPHLMAYAACIGNGLHLCKQEDV
uniref:alkaline phosphatase n=1 Tax=Glossina morsitans morsitans TaxID=37546 RepID=A0A1B0G0U5_GLOMM